MTESAGIHTDQIQVNAQSSIRIEGTCVLRFDPFQIGEPVMMRT